MATMARFMLATIPVLLQLHCTPCKGAELNSKRDISPKRGNTGYWLAFHHIIHIFFLEILDQECVLFNLLENMSITY